VSHTERPSISAADRLAAIEADLSRLRNEFESFRQRIEQLLT
jgi:hypothetical protein